MKKILVLMMFVSLFIGCSNNEEESVIESAIWYRAKTDNSWSNKLSATFCIFEDGEYDPETFKYSLILEPFKQEAEIKTKSGKIVKPKKIDFVSDSKEGMGIFNCNEGKYYVVTVVDSKKGGIIWMGKPVQVYEHKETIIEPVFKDLYTTGCIQWNE